MVDTIFNSILDNLTKRYIFYVPKRYYHYIEHTVYASIIEPHMVDIIAFADKDVNIISKASEIKGSEILKKSTLLDENISLLIQQQDELSELGFHHLLERYIEHASLHCVITLWMSKNVLLDIPTTTPILINMFETQADAFDKHVDKLEQYFGKKDIAPIQDVEHAIKIVSEPIETPEPKHEIATSVKLPNKSKALIQKKEKEKQTIITEKESMNLILETVFNIDPKYLDAN